MTVSRPILAVGSIVGLTVALGLGIAIGSSKIPDEVYIPSAVPSLVEVYVPSAVPSLVEVPVIPEDCQLAIDALIDESIEDLEFIVAVYDAYLDYPDENLAEFGRRVENILIEDSGLPAGDPPDLSACDR